MEISFKFFFGKLTYLQILIVLILMVSFDFPSAHAALLPTANADLDQVAYDNAGTFTSYTTAAINTTIEDVQSCGGSVNDALYIGMNYVFDRIAVSQGTACNSAHDGIWEYYNGTTWGTLTVTDGTNGFEVTPPSTYNIDITIPSNWTAVDPDGGGAVTTSAYFIRFRTTTGNADVSSINQLSSRELNFKIKVQDELGTAITGITSSAFAVSSCSVPIVYTFREMGSGFYELGLATQGADLNCDYSIVKDGYAGLSGLATGALSTTLRDLSGTPNSMQFSHKITVTREGDSTAFTPTTVVAGASNVSCTIASNIAYCPVLIADDNGSNNLTITVPSGYVTKIQTLGGNRSSNTSAQISTSASIQFRLKVVVKHQFNGSLTSATVTHGGIANVIASSNSYYFTTTSAGVIAAAKDGYVSLSILTNTGLASVSTNSTTQTVVTLGGSTAYTGADPVGTSVTGSGLVFSHIIGAIKEGDLADVKPTTVTAGASNLSCVIPSTSNYAFCAVTKADDNGTNVTVAINGYVTKTQVLAGDRDDDDDPQVTNAFTVQFLLKVIAKDELGNALSGATITHGGVAPTAISENSYYFPAIAAGAVAASKDGYVTFSTGTDTGVNSVSTNAAMQTVVTLSGSTPYTGADPVATSVTGSGLKVGHKISVTATNGDPLTGATLVAGGVACSEGVLGNYYCPVIFSTDSGTLVNVSKSPFVPNTVILGDRTSNANAQLSYNVALVAPGGGGAGASTGSSAYSPPSIVVTEIEQIHQSANEDVLEEQVNDLEEDSAIQESQNSTTITNVFNDIAVDPHVNEIQKLYDLKVINKSSNFNPDVYATRAEVVKVALLLFKFKIQNGHSPFLDVENFAWYKNHLYTAKTLGLIDGYANKIFKPDSYANHAETIKIFVLASGKDFVQTPSEISFYSKAWFWPYLNFLIENKLFKIDSEKEFKPGEFITRSDLAALAVKFLNI